MTWTCTEACSGAALFPCVKRMGGRRGWSWEEPWTSAWWWHWTSAEKPKISNVCTCRTEQVHLPSYLNSGKPQNDRENMPSSGCAEHMGQQLIILVWMWGTQYFSTDGEATIIQILTRNIFKKNQNNFSAFLGLFYCIYPPPFFFSFVANLQLEDASHMDGWCFIPHMTEIPECFTIAIKTQVPLWVTTTWDTVTIAILIFLKWKQVATFLRA